MNTHEPTYRQHKILEKVNPLDGSYVAEIDKDIELYWELVRKGYLDNRMVISAIEWKFIVTNKGLMYLADIANGQ